MQHWYYLAAAIALEIAGTTSMKLSLGFSRLTPSVLLFVFYLSSIIALTLALQKIEVSIALIVIGVIGVNLGGAQHGPSGRALMRLPGA